MAPGAGGRRGTQLTTWLRRAGLGRDLPAPVGVDVPSAAPPPTGPAASSDAPDAGVPAHLARRAVAATGRPEAAGALAELWRTLDPAERVAVGDPVGALGRAGRQSDPTTCGSAALVMLAAVGDPFLAAWLASGRAPAAGTGPPELAGAPSSALQVLAGASVARRFAVVQRVLRARTGRRAVLGTVPWPGALGTPPWTAARQARHAPYRFRDVVVDDTDMVRTEQVLDRVVAATRAGVPVPLYTGGDSTTGWSTALPRHVVLAVAVTPDEAGLVVWEPGSGRRAEVPRAALLAPAGPHPALGGWTHLTWAVLPEAPR